MATKRANAEARSRETVVSVGESILGVFLGRRATRAASSAMSKHRQTTLAKMEAEKAEEAVEAVRRDMTELEGEMRQEAQAIRDRWADALTAFEELQVTPRRTDVDVQMLSLAWAPVWQVSYDQPGGRHTDRVRAH